MRVCSAVGGIRIVVGGDGCVVGVGRVEIVQVEGDAEAILVVDLVVDLAESRVLVGEACGRAEQRGQVSVRPPHIAPRKSGY